MGSCRPARARCTQFLVTQRYDCLSVYACPCKPSMCQQVVVRPGDTLQVEGMVRAKMEQKEYIILCLEDSNDWSNATTRRLVMQVGNICLSFATSLVARSSCTCAS